MQVDLQGIRIFYQEWGQGPQTVLCFHGWGMNGDSWIPVARRFPPNQWRIIMPDLCGFGRSEKPPSGPQKGVAYYCEYISTNHGNGWVFCTAMEMTHLKVPTLLIRGQEDPLLKDSPDGLDEIPKALRVTTPGTGHYPC